MTQEELLVKEIKEAGLKATHQRIVILKALYENLNHPSSEELYGYIKKKNPSISLATIYKTLECFVNSGMIRKVPTSDGLMRYDGKTDQHNHIYLSNTNEIIDFYDEDLIHLISQHLSKRNIENLNVKNISLRIEGEKINLNKNIKIK